MQQNSAKVHAGKRDRVQAILPARSIFLVLLIAVSCALPSGIYGDNPGDPGLGSHSAPVPFTVGGRVDELYFYPCADCHAYMDPNNEVRELEVETGHPAVLEHGNGLIWCLSCHDSSDSGYGQLRNLLAEPINFDNGYQVCSGCHSQKYADWTHGAHGKRAANWQGERRLFSCVECHNPHSPAILPRAPRRPPPTRAGLKPMAPVDASHSRDTRRPEWEQIHAR